MESPSTQTAEKADDSCCAFNAVGAFYFATRRMAVFFFAVAAPVMRSTATALPVGLMTSGRTRGDRGRPGTSRQQRSRKEGDVVENIWMTSALWVGLALLASL